MAVQDWQMMGNLAYRLTPFYLASAAMPAMRCVDVHTQLLDLPNQYLTLLVPTYMHLIGKNLDDFRGGNVPLASIICAVQYNKSTE